MNPRRLAYWITTGLFCAVVAFSGFAHFTHQPMMVDAMSGLGYPLYFMTIIGLAKILGVIAVLVPERPLLKEWAYAGFFFTFVLASSAHLAVGDGGFAPALVAIILVAVSRFYDPKVFGEGSLAALPYTSKAYKATASAQ